MEEQFYLFWPTIEKMKSVAVRWGVLFAVFLVSELVSFGVLKGVIQGIYHDPQANYMPIYLITFAPIALGVCLAHILHDPRTYKIAFRIFGYRWAWLGWTIILGLIFYFFPSDQAGVPRLLRHLTLMFLLASMVIREDHFAARPLRFPLLVRIGVISYGLYLYHQWIIDFSGRFIQRFVVWLGVPQLSGFLVFVITSALCIVFADLSFRFFESPILRLRHRFQSQ
jgi:peptidoglycan/LPS O-acetylase OafA/YrhL